MPDLNSRPPWIGRKLGTEPAPHWPAACGAMSERKSRNIEREIESHDRGAQLVSHFVKHVLDKVRDRHQFETVLRGITGEHTLITFAQRCRVIEETYPP